jgi:predicted nucleotidyltransferase
MAEGMRPPSLAQIKSILRERREELALGYSVAEIGVFGSCVRSATTDESDIDILVEFSHPVGFFKFLELEERLGEWLGAKVDLVTKAALKPHIGRRVLDEVTML